MAPKALIFDVFGTCVDWRTSVARVVAAHLADVDATEFAMRWRAEYDPAMARIRTGNRGYVHLDVLHRENLDRVCSDLGVTPKEPDTLNLAWEQLDPWADVLPGLARLGQNHTLAPCSNGSIKLMTALKRYAQLPWDCILGAELAQNYKPHPAVYHAACAALQLPPDQILMVAAHNSDLAAARAEGLGTAFVPRRMEYGPDQKKDLEPVQDWDVIATDFQDLATQLSC